MRFLNYIGFQTFPASEKVFSDFSVLKKSLIISTIFKAFFLNVLVPKDMCKCEAVQKNTTLVQGTATAAEEPRM